MSDDGRNTGRDRSSSEEPVSGRSEEAPDAWRRDFARLGGVGIQFAAAVGLGAYGGLRLDRWLGTLPLCLILGVLLGFAAGFLALWARVSPASRSRSTNSRIPRS